MQFFQLHSVTEACLEHPEPEDRGGQNRLAGAVPGPRGGRAVPGARAGPGAVVF